MKKLPGLDGLRAIAASFVLIGHVYQISGFYGISKPDNILNNLSILGKDMVNLFFVISGFIITFTLLHENKSFKTISLKNFYIKRALRIWPLYFFLIAITYFVSNYSGVYDAASEALYGGVYPLDGSGVLMLSLFVTNFDHFFSVPLSVLPHYWSLSVEEQFYIVWPLLFMLLKPVRAAIFLIIAGIGLKVLADYMIHHGGSLNFWEPLQQSLMYSNYASMAIGALGAVCAFKNDGRLKIIFHPVIHVSCWAVFICSMMFRAQMPYIPFIYNELFAIVYLVLILNVTLNKNTILTLTSLPLRQVGKLSYGIYMYHWPLIPVIIYLLKLVGVFDFFIQYNQLPLIILVFLLTYLVSYISFKFLEEPFLRLKPKNQTVRITGIKQNIKVLNNERNHLSRR